MTSHKISLGTVSNDWRLMVRLKMKKLHLMRVKRKHSQWKIQMWVIFTLFILKTRTVFLHVHALIGKNYSFHASICYLLLLKEFRGHHGILYPRSSPFFQLEKEVIFSKHEPKRECDAENNEKTGGEVLEGNVLLRLIPKKCYPKRSKAATCRELLKQIEILTFVVYGNDALDHLCDPLSTDLKDFSRQAPHPFPCPRGR